MKTRREILYERSVKNENDKNKLERTALIYYPNYEKDIFIPVHIPYIEKFCDDASELGLYSVGISITDFSEAYYHAYVACLRKYTEKEGIHMTEPEFTRDPPKNIRTEVDLNSPEKSAFGRTLNYILSWGKNEPVN